MCALWPSGSHVLADFTPTFLTPSFLARIPVTRLPPSIDSTAEFGEYLSDPSRRIECRTFRQSDRASATKFSKNDFFALKIGPRLPHSTTVLPVSFVFCVPTRGHRHTIQRQIHVRARRICVSCGNISLEFL